MEMFLFSKSIIAVANSVKISRRVFLDRSQGLKCTKKLKISLVPEAYISLKLKKLKISLVPEAYISLKLEKISKIQLFSHLTLSLIHI